MQSNQLLLTRPITRLRQAYVEQLLSMGLLY